MTQYVKVVWHHADPRYPCNIYMELDDDRFETRKVEQYPDGTMGCAGLGLERGGAFLSEIAVPALSEIAKDPQFSPELITEELFSLFWVEALVAPPHIAP